MPFTTVQLSAQIQNPNLDAWANSTPQNQAALLPAFTASFNGIQTWIAAHGGANPFGWDNVQGLTHANGTPVVLPGPAQRAPFNDAFNDVRTHLSTPSFRLFQAAQAAQRLITVLHSLG